MKENQMDETTEKVTEETTKTGMAVPTPAKPGQIDLNLSAYERIYMKCWDAAGRIVSGTAQDSTERRVAIAELMFKRFFDDQIKVRVAGESARALEPMMDQLREFIAGRQFA